jgi:hypothetical protein
MVRSRSPPFVQLGTPEDDVCYMRGYSAFLALEEAGVPHESMTLTGTQFIFHVLQQVS